MGFFFLGAELQPENRKKLVHIAVSAPPLPGPASRHMWGSGARAKVAGRSFSQPRARDSGAGLSSHVETPGLTPRALACGHTIYREEYPRPPFVLWSSIINHKSRYFHYWNWMLFFLLLLGRACHHSFPWLAGAALLFPPQWPFSSQS